MQTVVFAVNTSNSLLTLTESSFLNVISNSSLFSKLMFLRNSHLQLTKSSVSAESFSTIPDVEIHSVFFETVFSTPETGQRSRYCDVHFARVFWINGEVECPTSPCTDDAGWNTSVHVCYLDNFSTVCSQVNCKSTEMSYLIRDRVRERERERTRCYEFGAHLC